MQGPCLKSPGRAAKRHRVGKPHRSIPVPIDDRFPRFWFFAILKDLMVHAVKYEPVSTWKSLITAILQAVLAKIACFAIFSLISAGPIKDLAANSLLLRTGNYCDCPRDKNVLFLVGFTWAGTARKQRPGARAVGGRDYLTWRWLWSRLESAWPTIRSISRRRRCTIFASTCSEARSNSGASEDALALARVSCAHSAGAVEVLLADIV